VIASHSTSNFLAEVMYKTKPASTAVDQTGEELEGSVLNVK
jgi:hypothetical protein